MTALSTIALYASYGIPILLGAFARADGRWRERGPWDLGGASPWVNAVALVWIYAAMVLFVLPPNEIAGVSLLVCGALLGVYWFGWLRRRFTGPPVLTLRSRPAPASPRR
jgi:hypothetical protein